MTTPTSAPPQHPDLHPHHDTACVLRVRDGRYFRAFSPGGRPEFALSLAEAELFPEGAALVGMVARALRSKGHEPTAYFVGTVPL